MMMCFFRNTVFINSLRNCTRIMKKMMTVMMILVAAACCFAETHTHTITNADTAGRAGCCDREKRCAEGRAVNRHTGDDPDPDRHDG